MSKTKGDSQKRTRIRKAVKMVQANTDDKNIPLKMKCLGLDLALSSTIVLQCHLLKIHENINGITSYMYGSNNLFLKKIRSF